MRYQAALRPDIGNRLLRESVAIINEKRSPHSRRREDEFLLISANADRSRRTVRFRATVTACNRIHLKLAGMAPSGYGTFGLWLPLLVPFTRLGFYLRVVLEQTSGEGCSAIRLRLERVWDVFVLGLVFENGAVAPAKQGSAKASSQGVVVTRCR